MSILRVSSLAIVVSAVLTIGFVVMAPQLSYRNLQLLGVLDVLILGGSQALFFTMLLLRSTPGSTRLISLIALCAISVAYILRLLSWLDVPIDSLVVFRLQSDLPALTFIVFFIHAIRNSRSEQLVLSAIASLIGLILAAALLEILYTTGVFGYVPTIPRAVSVVEQGSIAIFFTALFLKQK